MNSDKRGRNVFQQKNSELAVEVQITLNCIFMKINDLYFG